MKIANIFKLMTFFFCTITLFLVVFIFFFSINLKEKLEWVVYLSEIDRRCTEMTILISECRSYPSERTTEQLLSVSQSIHTSFHPITETTFYQNNRFSFQKIQDSIVNALNIIAILSDFFEDNGYSAPVTENEKFFLYTSQLLAETHQINQGVYEMIKQSNTHLIRQMAIARMIIFILLAIFLLFVFYQLYLLRWRVLTPLRWIDTALKNIHNGRFGYTINYRNKDELGTVAKVFNEMSANLVQSTVSRNKLEEELIKREKAELDLIQEKTHAQEMAKKAESANNAKDVFLANMSHEMRPPLTGINGTLELLEEQDLNEDAKFLLKLSRESATQMNHIIDDLLEISKISFGKFELHEQFFDLRESLQNAYQLFLINAKEKGLEYTVKKGNLPVQIYSDQIRIKQILNQLISNAIKFTPEGSIEVTVDFLRQDNQKGTLKLCVQDTGIGIDGSVMDHLYDYFYQKDMSLTKDYQGMGIGLAIVKYIVNAMHGKVDVKTKQDQGTSFTVTLPVSAYQEHEQAGTQKITQPMDKPSKIRRILNVEDNQINRVIVRKILEKHGYIVEEAQNGEVALAIVKNSPPFDLILMDIQMPRMDGYATRKAIRDLYGQTAPKMVALTGYQSDEDKKRINEAGFEGFLGKPYFEEGLLDIIKKMES